jgi:hypothetical protein
LEINWDFAGQDMSIELYEDDVVNEVIGVGYDFEVDGFGKFATRDSLDKFLKRQNELVLEGWIVLRAAGQYLHHALDFFFTTDDRV